MLFGFERRACDTNQILRFSLLDYRWERVKCVGDFWVSSGSTKPQDGTRGQTNQNSNGMNEVEQSQLSHVAFESASQDDLVSFDEPKYHPAG